MQLKLNDEPWKLRSRTQSPVDPGAYYLAGLALLIKLDARTTTTNIVAVLAFNLLMFALLALPLLGFLYAPNRTRSSKSWTTGRAVIAAAAAGHQRPIPPHRRTHRPQLT
jgi:hypothetical protein